MTRVIPVDGKVIRNPEKNNAKVPKEGIVIRESGVYWTHWKKQEREGGVKLVKVVHKKPNTKQKEEGK